MPALTLRRVSARGAWLALAAGLLCACSDGRPAQEGAMLSWEEVAQRPAALELPGPVKVWAAQRTPEIGAYYVFSGAPIFGPFMQGRSALRIVLLKGRARLRVGGVSKESGPGGYAAVPAGEAWSLERLGGEPAVFSLLASPDVGELSGLMVPVPEKL